MGRGGKRYGEEIGGCLFGGCGFVGLVAEVDDPNGAERHQQDACRKHSRSLRRIPRYDGNCRTHAEARQNESEGIDFRGKDGFLGFGCLGLHFG